MGKKTIDFTMQRVASRGRKSKAGGEKNQKRLNYIHPWERKKERKKGRKTSRPKAKCGQPYPAWEACFEIWVGWFYVWEDWEVWWGEGGSSHPLIPGNPVMSCTDGAQYFTGSLFANEVLAHNARDLVSHFLKTLFGFFMLFLFFYRRKTKLRFSRKIDQSQPSNL